VNGHPRRIGADRATVGEQLFSFWRPALVNGAVPALITALTGWHYGFGSGWMLTATRVVGWVLAGLWVWWFWWPVGQFLRAGISLNPMWRWPSPLLRLGWRLGYPRRGRPPVLLITWGAFEHSQAPMFFGVYSGLAAAGFLASPWVFVWAVLFIAVMSGWVLRRERPKLRLEAAGAAAWQERTPSLVPWRLPVTVALAAVYWMLRLARRRHAT
jgi:hypothetical protein